MYERTWTVVCPANAGPQVFVIPDMGIPDSAHAAVLEAWSGDGVAGNVFLYDGDLSLADAQAKEGVIGRYDCLMVVPAAGSTCVRIPGDIEDRITVFFDAAVQAQPQAVSVRIRQIG